MCRTLKSRRLSSRSANKTKRPGRSVWLPSLRLARCVYILLMTCVFSCFRLRDVYHNSWLVGAYFHSVAGNIPSFGTDPPPICLLARSATNTNARPHMQANKAKRKVIFKRAESYVRQYLTAEKEEIRLKRVARAAGDFYVPAQAKVYFVVRIRGWVCFVFNVPAGLDRYPQYQQHCTEAPQNPPTPPSPSNQQWCLRQGHEGDRADAPSG